MNYELAKKLKEAGFPQSEYWGDVTDTNDKVVGFVSEYGMHTVPTLSELIEACVTNKEERCIYRLDYDWFEKQWRANAGTVDEHFAGYGSTPEEAVAKLYLELNK